MLEELREKKETFQEWQKRPHKVKPLGEDEHICQTCGTRFEGNYCPRCGQSAMIGRYSFKKAFLLFLDVWGLGNRGMFRSIRDLILRPGYMIHDYLRGMQMAYFPPFKMYFLIATLTLLIATGLNIKGVNQIKEQTEKYEVALESQNNAGEIKDQANEYSKIDQLIQKSVDKIKQWGSTHMTIASLLIMLLFSGPLFLFFRRCPNIPDLRFSEFFVAMVYTSNMISIYHVFVSFFCMSEIIQLVLYILAIIPIKQLTGYSYLKTTLKFLIALILFAFIFLVAICIIIFALAFYYA